jgi:hypothetical protein
MVMVELLEVVELDKSCCKLMLLVTFFWSCNNPSTCFLVGIFDSEKLLVFGTWIAAFTVLLKGKEEQSNVEVCMEAKAIKNEKIY